MNILPNANEIIITDEKFVDYILNKNHSVGYNKAIAFEQALGYNKNNYKKLIENIKENILKFNASKKDENKYGKKYEVLMQLLGENNKRANVITSWIVDSETNKTRFVTVYVTNRKIKRGE